MKLTPEDIREEIIESLKTIFDPEIPVNIYDLGLIYDIQVDEQGRAGLEMTLTSPMCPVAESLPVEVEKNLREIKGVTDVDVQVVWDPPWSPDLMSDEAKLKLNLL
ncbi:MAG: SUF system Fe-S cluster assembly protein [candidate division KSB1 bacterium]|nr:SUF system Fe-S cluster assembly protein [candidate division KSB1 bacterium]